MIPEKSPIFAFDLDGTITRAEMLPRLAAELNDAALEAEIVRLTAQTLSGEIPFRQSFRRRFAILNRLPLDAIQAVAKALPLDPDILEFIRKNRADCAVVTGNLDRWIEPLTARLGCRLFCSKALAGADGRLELGEILDKGEAMRALKADGRPVVAVGESAGDLAMFLEADFSIAFAGLHEPAPALLGHAGKVCRSGKELCVFLEGLTSRPFSGAYPARSNRP
ncbi:MAG: HAD-IB family phosphatase [Deltaproteobacteria bacterium]|jgi:HAD superfamily phosphoserine phosphatase-like hydrolase|nr:HAD-IB family phosphatase [Deltaproteobacteria bacterium]